MRAAGGSAEVAGGLGLNKGGPDGEEVGSTIRIRSGAGLPALVRFQFVLQFKSRWMELSPVLLLWLLMPLFLDGDFIADRSCSLS